MKSNTICLLEIRRVPHRRAINIPTYILRKVNFYMQKCTLLLDKSYTASNHKTSCFLQCNTIICVNFHLHVLLGMYIIWHLKDLWVTCDWCFIKANPALFWGLSERFACRGRNVQEDVMYSTAGIFNVNFWHLCLWHSVGCILTNVFRELPQNVLC